MRIRPLDSSLEPRFWELVNQDIPDYYFFIVNMKRSREFTEIWVALSNRNRIEGMLMTHRNIMAQLRGTVDAAKALLCKLNLEKVDIQGPTECQALILEKYRNIKKASEITLMTLRRGEEDLQIRHSTVRLSTSDAEDMAALMRRENPDWWGEMTAERIASGMDQRLWLGIKSMGGLFRSEAQWLMIGEVT